jgi:serpin B
MTEPNQRAFELVVANALWAQKGFDLNPAFVELVRKRYAAGLEPLDFTTSAATREEARKTINAWVEKTTRDKIKDLIGPGVLDEQTRLVLTNAIYFKANWEDKFYDKATQDEPFHLHGDAGDAQVRMMHMTHMFRYAETDDVQVLELPYTRDRLAMIVVLPRKPDGLATVEQNLTAKSVDAWIGGLDRRLVELSLPKFKFTSHFRLGKTLRDMGMADAFSTAADFSGITSAQRLVLQDVIHQAYVDAHEEGTEAAAATAVMAGAMAMPPPPKKAVFRADHPFLFLIRHNDSGAILFLGRVNNPAAK